MNIRSFSERSASFHMRGDSYVTLDPNLLRVFGPHGNVAFVKLVGAERLRLKEISRDRLVLSVPSGEIEFSSDGSISIPSSAFVNLRLALKNVEHSEDNRETGSILRVAKGFTFHCQFAGVFSSSTQGPEEIFGHSSWAGERPNVLLQFGDRWPPSSSGSTFEPGILFFQGPPGQFPGMEVIESWAENFDLLVLMHHGLYMKDEHGHNFAPPYIPVDRKATKEFLCRCLSAGVLPLLYVSPYYYAFERGALDEQDFLVEVSRLLSSLPAGGVYVDGVDFHNASTTLRVLRSLKNLVGDYGSVVAHLTHGNMKCSFLPSAGFWCSAIIRGEGYDPKTLQDGFLRYGIDGGGVGEYNTAFLHTSVKNIPQDRLIEFMIDRNWWPVSFVHYKKDNEGKVTWWGDGKTSFWKTWRSALDRRYSKGQEGSHVGEGV